MQREIALLTQDHLKLYAQIWEPDSAAQAALCLVHGIGDHSGRYTHVAAAFNSARIACLGFDQRGHGQSPGKRGHIPNFSAALDDLALALTATQEQFPQVPLFLYGHSLGGNLVLNYTLQRKPKVAGVIVTSPWLKLAFEPPAAQVSLARFMNRIMPGFTQTNELDLEALSRDPQVIKAYKDDPLVHDRISARLFVDFFASGYWALEHAQELSLPLLLVHGSADRLTSPAASQEFAEKAGSHCTLKLWEGLYHETHNEPEKDQVLAYNLQWLEAHLS